MMQRRLLQTLVNGRSRGCGPSMIRSAVARASNTARCFGSTPHDESSLVVVGSGVAGCSTALIAAERYNVPVTLLCAGSLPTDCNSYWAQGGIIYRNYDKTSGDSVQSLSSDVHRAGDGLCVNEAVLKLAQEGPERVRELLLGSQSSFADVPFERDETGSLKLCLGT
jgi:L-aspartate oxidase